MFQFFIIFYRLINRKYSSQSNLARQSTDDFIASLRIETKVVEEDPWEKLVNLKRKVIKKGRTLSETVTYMKPVYSGSPGKNKRLIKRNLTRTYLVTFKCE